MQYNRRPGWQDFVQDFGDAIGGGFIGYACGPGGFGYAMVGIVLILWSVYLRFYHRDQNIH